MGISFHITSVREGTVFNVLQFLGLEQVSGTLSLRFHRDLPEARLFIDSGKLLAAEFGELLADSVLDFLICQEFGIKEINFEPGRVKLENHYAAVKKGMNISEALLNVSKDVDMCAARSSIYGLVPIEDNRSNKAKSLLDVIYNFSRWENELKQSPRGESSKQIPLRQCALLHNALKAGNVKYTTPLIGIKEMEPLMAMLEPLSASEKKNLNGYMKSLLPHGRASHMPRERFHAFAVALESMANRRSPECGENVRTAVKELLEKSISKNGSDS